jgi:hypothetical protein
VMVKLGRTVAFTFTTIHTSVNAQHHRRYRAKLEQMGLNCVRMQGCEFIAGGSVLL